MHSKKKTKSEIVEQIYKHLQLDLKDIRAVADLFLQEVKDALIDGKSVELRGFGTFEVRDRKGRAKARNPKTGEIVSVKDHSVVAFRAGKDLKSSVWDLNDRKVAEKKD
ncbi:MAG TPA: integration host factor subunit beta [Treponema sp.]|nr:integration host factor subunit beta [Treponema sp.]